MKLTEQNEIKQKQQQNRSFVYLCPGCGNVSKISLKNEEKISLVENWKMQPEQISSKLKLFIA